MLHGKLVSLRAVEKEDLEQVRDWLTDPDLLYALGARPIPIANLEPDKLSELFRLRDGRVLAILTRDRNLVLGLIAVGNFHEFNRTAQVIVVIGDRSEWNRGYGSDALRTVTRFAFDDLNLNCIEAVIPEFNNRALSVFQKVGFVVEGKLRSRLFLRGRYWDQAIVSALRETWTGKGSTEQSETAASQPEASSVEEPETPAARSKRRSTAPEAEPVPAAVGASESDQTTAAPPDASAGNGAAQSAGGTP